MFNRTNGDFGSYVDQGKPSANAFPASRGYHCTVFSPINQSLIIFGGAANVNGWVPLNDLWAYNMTSLMWTWLGGNGSIYQPDKYSSSNNFAYPGGRMYSACTYVASTNSIFIFGGQDANGAVTNQLIEYKLNTRSWSLKQPMPPGLVWPTLVSYNDEYLVLFGGGSSTLTVNTSYMWFYQIINHVWTEKIIPTNLAPRYIHSGVFDSDRRVMYIFGGYKWGNTLTNELWEFNITGYQWKLLNPVTSPFISARAGALMVYNSISKSINIFAGQNNGNHRTFTSYFAI